MGQIAKDAPAEVRENPGEHRFEIWVGEQRAGLTVYEPDADVYAYVHTEIDPAFEGRGLASQLIRTALDSMRARHLGVLPYCPFVQRYIQRHDAYLDLVPSPEREHFDLPATTAPAAP